MLHGSGYDYARPDLCDELDVTLFCLYPSGDIALREPTPDVLPQAALLPKGSKKRRSATSPGAANACFSRGWEANDCGVLALVPRSSLVDLPPFIRRVKHLYVAPTSPLNNHGVGLDIGDCHWDRWSLSHAKIFALNQRHCSRNPMAVSALGQIAESGPSWIRRKSCLGYGIRLDGRLDWCGELGVRTPMQPYELLEDQRESKAT